MALPKEVAGYVKRAIARGASVDGDKLRLPDGTQVGIPQSARYPVKLRNFRAALDESGIWDVTPIREVVEPLGEGTAVVRALTESVEVSAPEPEVVWISSKEAAELKGVSTSAVLDWARNSWVPMRKGVVKSDRGRDMVEFDREALLAFEPPKRSVQSSKGAITRKAGGVRVSHADTAAGRLKEASVQVKHAIDRMRKEFESLDEALTTITKEVDAALQESADLKVRVKKIEDWLGRGLDMI